MTSPNQSLQILDPGLGLSDELADAPLIMGCSSSGSTSALAAVSSIPALVTAYGQGPMVEDAAMILGLIGGPVLVLRLPSTTAGAAGSVTASGGGPTVSVAGAANDAYEAIITIVAGGILGTGTFKYSLDDGNTTSETLTIPSGGTYAIPNTGLTLTFAAGTYVAAETYSFDCTEPIWSTADITAGMVIGKAYADFIPWGLLSGSNTLGSDAATAFSTLATSLASWQTGFKFSRFLMSASREDDAAVKADFAGVESARIAACVGGVDMTSRKPFAGWSAPFRPTSTLLAMRAASAVLSEDLGRVKSGPLLGVHNPTTLTHDERTAAVSLNNDRLATVRTYEGRSGLYANNVRLKSASGSDFKYWQHGRVMDVACKTVVTAQQAMFSDNPRALADGKIDPRDAASYETEVEGDLRQQLTEPKNASGTAGHVSSFSYAIDRTNNIVSTETINGEVSITPLAYPKTISTTIGFTVEVAT